MTLVMADGPVANLPPGLDAYAGYVNQSGIGKTWPEVVKIPALYHLSITTDGSPAMTADVESGAMNSWAGYDVGYCSVSNVNDLIAAYGRPKKLWTAHDDPRIGAHLCSPACWPGLVTVADGTQWGFHGGWDESWLLDNFFDLAPKPGPPPPPPPSEENMETTDPVTGGVWAVVAATGAVEATGAPYLGNLVGNRFGWQEVGRIAGISARKAPDGTWGYDIAVLRPGPQTDGEWYSHYYFPRDGSQA